MTQDQSKWKHCNEFSVCIIDENFGQDWYCKKCGVYYSVNFDKKKICRTKEDKKGGQVNEHI